MRSVTAADYQDVPRPVAVMDKAFAQGSRTGAHSHKRAQLLYAASGLMTAAAAHGAWVVPEGHALLIPPGVEHEVAMHGPVAMRSAYLAADVVPEWPARCRVLKVSALLEASLAALAEEPVVYDEGARGGHLAALILDEIARAPETSYVAPMPADARLRRLCEALVDDPAAAAGLDDWAVEIGMSRRTLTRRFREETGLSFGDWRARLRLFAAMARQARGEEAREVAAGVGYADPRALQAMMRRLSRQTAG
ncbi:AraC family transcriptional regulator [Chenggangzhangella methanolivorans]|uniref:Helix-turn-helix transcriptional regulator n=1 Tax=Chenggangzhangella methanolivorans TaxID=1437009 RepID=A0A9E6UIQ7_9HYPH|nr:helix-turn-helix transcriptional regulator [Chenggangzhangella methanolivorans]QZO01143.1 helix-turn-helix transcriptional regulator [Chenggangzhangella methanolivorans]